MALPCGATGSLNPTFVPARPVCLAVKHPYAFTLYARLPTVLRVPLGASVTPYAAPASGLDFTCSKGGISRVAPKRLATSLHSLPPILHMLQLKPM